MAGLSDLPLELISLIVDLAAGAAPPFALHRTLSRLALIHPHFTNPAQARIFKSITINTAIQLRSLSAILTADPKGRLGGYVRHLSAESEGDRIGTAHLNALAKACPKLDSVAFGSMGVDVVILTDCELKEKLLNWCGGAGRARPCRGGGVRGKGTTVERETGKWMLIRTLSAPPTCSTEPGQAPQARQCHPHSGRREQRSLRC